MAFRFKRRWNFDNSRLLDTRDLSSLTDDPESDLAVALTAWLEDLALEASLPPGGATGTVLTKASNADGDVQWAVVAVPIGVPSGGNTNQVLRKTGTGDTALGWVDLPAPANTAAAVTYAGSAGLSGANVEAALDELDAEKAPVVHTHAQSDVTGLSTALTGKAATTTGARIDHGTSLPAAGNAGRLFVLHA